MNEFLRRQVDLVKSRSPGEPPRIGSLAAILSMAAKSRILVRTQERRWTAFIWTITPRHRWHLRWLVRCGHSWTANLAMPPAAIGPGSGHGMRWSRHGAKLPH